MNAALAREPAADAAQTRAIFHAWAAGSLAVCGPAGSGKTFVLVERARHLAAGNAANVLITAPSDAGVLRLRAALVLEPSRAGREDAYTAERSHARLVCASLGDVAFDVLRRFCGREVEAIDDVAASLHFESVGASLFALDWTEFVSAEIDPEITGLRAPERFAAAAFRLIRKLRASLVSPDDFRSAGLRGAATFYANKPNFADPELLAATSAKYRGSLRPSDAELEGQRRREIDLVRILARLYASYTEALTAKGCLTPTDAVYEAALALRAQPEARRRARTAYAAILVDDAQDVSAAGLALLAQIAAEDFGNVTFAGDPAQSTRAFAGGGRGSAALQGATTTIELDGRYRSAAPIERVARAIVEPRAGLARSDVQPDSGSNGRRAEPAVEFYRGSDMADEARYVAAAIARRCAEGTPPQRIAVVTRNLRCAGSYADALLARNIPVDVAGAASLFDFRGVGDALAALWIAVDPYRHDFVLRALASPWLGLSDASLAILCGDAPDAQPLLFEPPTDDAEPVRTGRWDHKRDIRLGRNLTHGDVDSLLSPDARARIGELRSALTRWEALARNLEPPALARVVLAESVEPTLQDDARGRFERHLLERLRGALDTAAERDPLASLHDLLRYLEMVANAEDDLLALEPRDEQAVGLFDVEAAKGRTFDAVFAVDVRAGAWPRYYTPDAFLFLPSLGMIPKENVGDDATAARTAKFTYALARYQLREKYDDEDRRALYVAASRARDFLSISASGRPTRGRSTPELLEELRAKFEV